MQGVDFYPLFPTFDGREIIMQDERCSGLMPIIALRGIAVFPDQTVHFDVGRLKSVMALESAMKKDQILMLVPQKDILDDDPSLPDLYPVGTVVKVKQILKSQGDNIRILVSGLARAKITQMVHHEPKLECVLMFVLNLVSMHPS